MIQEFLSLSYFNNTLRQYLISTGAFIGGIIIIKIFSLIIIGRLKKISKETETTLDDFIIQNAERALVPIFYFSLLYYSTTSLLRLAPWLHKFIHLFFIAGVTFFGIRLGTSLIKFALTRYWGRQTDRDAEEVKRNVRGISALVNIIVWSIGLIFLLDNLGFKISAVMAGLGIGGIAVALASQTILGDLFSYFVIFFDRPFRIGDFILIENDMGFVEKIGIKTTRIKSLSGEQLVFSNTYLTNTRIHNFRQMQQRRIVFTFGVVYHTSIENLESIPEIIRGIIEKTEHTAFDRAHFKEYGDSSLNYEVVYFVDGPDYNRYMDIQHSINLAIFKEFAKRNIEFAFPTRTVHLEKQ